MSEVILVDTANQPVGTAIIALSKLSAYAHAGKDKSRLERAVWILFNYNGHKFRIVTAY